MARAQDNAGITGTVTDSTGAVLPDAVVTLTNPSRGIKFTAKTNHEGSYRLPNVPPAPGYKITVEHAGFTSTIIDNFSLVVGITRTQDAKLVAGTSTAVEVTASNNVVTLNTTDASIGNNFDVQQLDDLPVLNRNTPAGLFYLQPGVNSVGSVTGARTDQSTVTVDGMDVNDISTGGFGTVVARIPVDATQEFRGTVAGLPSYLGTGSGGQFQLVTKSGTDKFHGNINEYHRDTATVSNLWFNKNATTAIPRTPLIRNQFGGNIGGPILHDKLFFFADFLDIRTIASTTSTRTVPLDSYRAGNISYVKTGCSPTSRQDTNAACIGMLTPAQVKALDPLNATNPAAAGENATVFALLNSRYPRANDFTLGDNINTGGYRFTEPTPTFEYDGVGRLDYNLTSKQRLFAQYHITRRDATQSTDRFGGDPQTRPFHDRSYGYVLSHVWQLGNNKVNQFYFGDNVQIADFPLTFNPNGSTYVSGFGPFTAPYDGGNIQRRRIPIPTVRDDFNWQLGEHTLGFGGSFKFIKTSNLLINDYNFYTIGLGGVTTALNSTLRPADISTTNPATGAAQTTNTSQFDSAFALALGRVASVTSNYNYNSAGAVLPQQTGSIRRFRYYQTEAYFGDTWKVNKQLTFSYGVRYQYYSVPFDSGGAESIPSMGFDQFLSNRVSAAKGQVSGNTAVPFLSFNLGGSPNNAPGFFAPNWHDFAPRFSVAYNPSFLPKTVFNASADVVYDRTVYNAINFIQNQSSFIFQSSTVTNYGQTSANAALAADPRLGSTLTALPAPPVAPTITKPYTPYVNAAGAPTGFSGGNSINAVDPNLKTPYNVTVNAGVQQEFPAHFIMRLNYVGRFGRRLLGQADASQLVDYVDPVSGQSLSQAFAGLTNQIRNNRPANLLTGTTPQPFFENQINRSIAGYGNKTAIISYNQTALSSYGDITDLLRFLIQNSLIAPNVGVGAQFADADYYTNKGSSSYNGLLLTVSKNLSQGVKFDLNYTLSHSIDNVSVVANTVANGTGFICDALNLRACRGNSDFDTTHNVNANFLVKLPVGRGQRFGGNIPLWLDEAIGGWSVSGIPIWQSGFATTTSTGAFIAGFANNDAAIFDGSKSDDLAIHKHKDASNANRLVAYNDYTKTLSHFRGPLGIEYGSRNVLRGPSQFYFDAGLGKDFTVLPEKLKLRFRADAFNVLNHPTFGLPATSIVSPTTFGAITGQTGSPTSDYAGRVGQFSLRLEF